jgi:pyruvate dehydrogenase E2 component (dihydrolipoamide acetyltransferase)
MTASKQGVPHYYLTTEVTLDKVLALRKRLNGVLGGGKEDAAGLSLNDVIVKAAGLALKRVPACNSAWNASNGTVRQYGYADIGIVMSSEGGISAPVVRDADTAGLSSISARVAALAAAAADGSLTGGDAAGATFTVTNLGGYGVKQFAPVIVPPQACSLGVGTVTRRVVPATGDAAASGNKFATATTVAVTLSCDHRVVDGAVGAEWLAAFKGLLEEPETMLL